MLHRDFIPAPLSLSQTLPTMAKGDNMLLCYPDDNKLVGVPAIRLAECEHVLS